MSVDPPPDAGTLLKQALGARTASRLRRAGLSLRQVGTLTVSELQSQYGLTPKAAEKAVAVLELAKAHATEPLVRGAAFRGSEDVFRAFGARLRDLKVEQFWVVLIDGKHRIVKEVLVSQGTLTSSPVHPREVFTAAIRHGAAALIVCHNHPSGDASPSADDLEITRRLVQVGDLVGIRVLDHVVIGDGCYVSFTDRGLMS